MRFARLTSRQCLLGFPRSRRGADLDHGSGKRYTGSVHVYGIDALVDIPGPGAQGVLFAHGSRFGGHAAYIKDNRLHPKTSREFPVVLLEPKA
jgi:hypothetical protein